MNKLRRCLLTALLFLTAGAANTHAQATNVYVTPSGTAVGNCPAGTSAAPNFTPAQFNNSSNWGSSTGKIGPGTKVLACGTLTFGVNANGLSFQGSGTSGSPIWFLADTGTIIQSPQFSDQNNSAAAGGISVLNQNYIVIDGGSNGIIQNTANGSTQTYAAGSVGVQILGTGVKLRNWTIKNIYLNNGNVAYMGDGGGGSCPGGGSYPAGCDTRGGGYDVVVIDGSTKVSICNNNLWNGRAGLQINTMDLSGGGEGTQALCQGNTTDNGANVYLNSFNDHDWDIVNGGEGLGPWIYANDFSSSHLNWQTPSNTYHQDGIISFGYLYDVGQSSGPVIFNNLFNANFGNLSNWTAEVFCTPSATQGSASYCNMFNNIFTMQGYGNNGLTQTGSVGYGYITRVAITSNVLTITAPGNACAGSQVTFAGLTTATFLNGQTVTIASCTPNAGNFTANTSFTANFTHANYGPTVDSGGTAYANVATPAFLANNTWAEPASCQATAGACGGIEFDYGSPETSDSITHINNIMTMYSDPLGSPSRRNFVAEDLGLGPQVAWHSDYNLYYMFDPVGGSNCQTWQWGQISSGYSCSLTTWQASCGCDAHALNTNPNFDMDGFHVPSTSAVKGAGENLTSLYCGTFSALCYDKPVNVGVGGDTIGNPRPATGAWDIGAYSADSAGGAVGPPSGLALSNGGSVGAHTVTITWYASSTSGATYFIYRGSTSGGESGTPLNMSGVGTSCTGPSAGCTYTDSSVLAGQTAYYVAKAYSSSAYSTESNEVSTTLPVSAPTGLALTAH